MRGHDVYFRNPSDPAARPPAPRQATTVRREYERQVDHLDELTANEDVTDAELMNQTSLCDDLLELFEAACEAFDEDDAPPTVTVDWSSDTLHPGK